MIGMGLSDDVEAFIQHLGFGRFSLGQPRSRRYIAALLLCLLLLLAAFHRQFTKKINRLRECIVVTRIICMRITVLRERLAVVVAVVAVVAVADVVASPLSRSLVLFNSLKQCLFKRARLDDGTRPYFTFTSAFGMSSGTGTTTTTSAPQQ